MRLEMELWKLPAAASSLLHAPLLETLPRRQCALSILFEDELYAARKATLLFTGVEHYSVTYMSSCDPDVINLAYGRLVEITDSRLMSDFRTGHTNKKILRHLAIFFDDGPLYQFICEDFRID
jgi:hypothetical protein